MQYGYLKDPTKHDVSKITLHKYHAIKKGTANISHCSGNTFLDIDTKTPSCDISKYTACIRCKKALRLTAN